MIYKLAENQVRHLLQFPESGTGYQFIHARKSLTAKSENFLVLNAEVIIELDGTEELIMDKIIHLSAAEIMSEIAMAELLDIKVISKFVKAYPDRAIHHPVENSGKHNRFVRLSVFHDDKRIDKKEKRLLPGSFATTLEDYFDCTTFDWDPLSRYALPNPLEIQWAFFFKPTLSDEFQTGIVPPLFGWPGGGIEVYFEKGTTQNTLAEMLTY